MNTSSQMEDGLKPDWASGSGCNVFIVLTHYQILVATALTLWSKRPARLYVLRDYLELDEDFAEQIRSTGVFQSVVFYSELYEINAFYSERDLRIFSRNDDLLETIHRHFDPLYREVFSACVPTDTCFIFNEVLYSYYYTESFFNTIIKVEDGYKSFPQELQVQHFGRGPLTDLKLEGRGLPLLKARSPKIKKIIVSEDSDRIPDQYRPLLYVLDMRDLWMKLDTTMKDIVTRMFQLNQFRVPANSVLILTQPLARARYCSVREQYELYAKICRDYGDGRSVYIKPHPADKVDYSGLTRHGVIIWDKDFPVDLLNYSDLSFAIGVTFGSTSLRDAQYVDEAIYLFEEEQFTVDDVSHAIREYIGHVELGITYCLDGEGTTEQIAATVNSLTSMKNKGNMEILLATSPSQSLPAYPSSSPVRVIPCGGSLHDRYLTMVEEARFSYVVMTSPGYTYSRGLHTEAIDYLRRFNLDCLVLGLKQFFRGKEVIRRVLQRAKSTWETEPYFLENKVFSQQIARETLEGDLPYTDGAQSLQFYTEMLSRCRQFAGVDYSYVSFEGDSSIPLNWPVTYHAYSFDDQVDTCTYLVERHRCTGEDVYLTTLVGVVFWLMGWANQPWSMQQRYNDFLSGDLVRSISRRALNALYPTSSYADSNIGEMRPLIDMKRMKKILRIFRRVSFTRFLSLVRSRLIR